MATVLVTAEALEQAGRLTKRIHARVLALVERLKKCGAKPLRGKLAGWYRLRTGDYRVRFRVAGEEITVDKIGHRSEFYGD